MKPPKFIPLSQVHKREEDFSAELSKNLDLLGIGVFEESETEAPVGTRYADIVAKGDDGTLVIENQFGRADWDHWGRLEAYARLKDARFAAIVAEDFEDLMIVTCRLRNEDSKVDWFLIQARVTDRQEYVFQTVAGPDIDIQTERGGVEYSKFWAPIRATGLFAGNPVPVKYEDYIGKSVRGVQVVLYASKYKAYIQAVWPIKKAKIRNQYVKRFRALGGVSRNTNKFAIIAFTAIDKGRADVKHWDEIRMYLTELGKEIYDEIAQS